LRAPGYFIDQHPHGVPLDLCQVARGYDGGVREVEVFRRAGIQTQSKRANDSKAD